MAIFGFTVYILSHFTVACMRLYACVPVCVHGCRCVHVFCFHFSAGICERHLTVCASLYFCMCMRFHVYTVEPIICRLLLLFINFVSICRAFCVPFAVQQCMLDECKQLITHSYFLLSFCLLCVVCMCGACVFLCCSLQAHHRSLQNCCWLSFPLFSCFQLGTCIYASHRHSLRFSVCVCARAFVYVLPQLLLLLLSAAAMYFLTLALCMPMVRMKTLIIWFLLEALCHYTDIWHTW